METIFLSLRAQVAVSTFFMKSPVYPYVFQSFRANLCVSFKIFHWPLWLLIITYYAIHIWVPNSWCFSALRQISFSVPKCEWQSNYVKLFFDCLTTSFFILPANAEEGGLVLDMSVKNLWFLELQNSTFFFIFFYHPRSERMDYAGKNPISSFKKKCMKIMQLQGNLLFCWAFCGTNRAEGGGGCSS